MITIISGVRVGSNKMITSKKHSNVKLKNIDFYTDSFQNTLVTLVTKKKKKVKGINQAW